jgi:VanZ family protein
MQKFINTLALSLYCGLIFWLSSKTQLPAPSLFAYQDKLQHFLAYWLLGVLAWRAFAHLNLSRQRLLWLSMGFCSLYGLSDEWHQSFVVGRNASAWDWLADNMGSVAAMCSLYGWRYGKTV